MAVSNLRLGGITSGFDTEAMVTQLLSSYQTRIDKQSQKITKLSWQQSAYQDITKKITEFKNTYFDVLKRDTYLMSPSTFNKFKADVTATSNADASDRQHDFKLFFRKLQDKAEPGCKGFDCPGQFNNFRQL